MPEEVASSPSTGSPSRAALGLLGVVGAALLLGASLSGVDVRRMWGLVLGIGPPAVLLATPFLLSVVLESMGFRRIFRVFAVDCDVTGLLRVRVATDALGGVLPLGALLVEAAKPKLLQRHAGVPLGMGVAGVAARKCALVLSQAVYLTLGFFAGWKGLSAAFERLLGHPELAGIVLVAAVVLAAAAFGVAFLLRGGTAAHHVLSALARVPSARFRVVLARWRGDIARTDETLSRFFRSGASTHAKILCFYVGAWLLEATETWVMLRALGASVGWGDAVGIEALVMLARNVLVILPGGLGVQELGYGALLVGVTGDLGVCAAFALLKRARELMWVVFGFLLLGWDQASAGPLARIRSPLGLPPAGALQVGE